MLGNSFGDVDGIHLTQDREQWYIFFCKYRYETSGTIKCGDIFDYLSVLVASKIDSVPWSQSIRFIVTGLRMKDIRHFTITNLNSL
jgi:hypothetical protein